VCRLLLAADLRARVFAAAAGQSWCRCVEQSGKVVQN
jgi:hypothetical protein